MRKVVANTTPLIALADIGYLDLLQKLYQEILCKVCYAGPARRWLFYQ